ncbi:hypothetical protein GJ744_000448 [Endocarpon pusillum]|uniref:Uncharacterized protein n=1 Tax=Endocarpon pusillum TaxID=364733 RepID=A0A8H7AEU0_9EURO|nr:hypothetical protein GJ744_000448 [Endocarpon pusillum]
MDVCGGDRMLMLFSELRSRHLTKNIPNVLNGLQDEVRYAFMKNIGDVKGML